MQERGTGSPVQDIGIKGMSAPCPTSLYACEYACVCVHAATLQKENRCLSPPLVWIM